MTIIEKMYAGEKLSRNELRCLVTGWSCDTEPGEYEEIDLVEGDCSRWTQDMKTIIQVGNDLWAIPWDRGLTECQENEFWEQPYRVERKERVVTQVYYEKKLGGLTVERLTYDFCVGSVHCNQVRGADNLECGEVCQRQDDDGCATCPIARAFDRLAAIEDILGDVYDLDRLRELVQADREGRCVVLPCKLHDKVFFIENGCVKETEVDSFHNWTSGRWKISTHTDRMYEHWKGYEIDFSGIGKTVFLSREDAEKAVEMEKNGND